MKSKYISGYQKGKLKIYDMIAFVENTECMVIRPDCSWHGAGTAGKN